MYCGLFESEVVSTPIGSGNRARRTLASLLEARNRFPGLRSPCPIAKVIKPAVLVRLVRSCQHAIRWRSAALCQVHLYSLRLLFHAHPPQLADQLDEFVRRSLLCQNIRWLLFFERHFHRRFPSSVFDHHVALRYSGRRTRLDLYFLAHMTVLPRAASGFLADINPRWALPSFAWTAAPDYAPRESLFCSFASRTVGGTAGNCSTCRPSALVGQNELIA